MRFSVVMTCWGKLESVTSKCLPSFYQRPAGDWELIVVDNASPDDTAAWLFQQQQEHPEVPLRVIELSGNLGYAGGLNAGLDAANGEYIVCLNNDIICYHPKWLEVLFAPIEENPKRMVGPRLIVDNAMTDVGAGPVPYLEGWMIGATR
jgi:GT2 family glycosyltransferase